MKIFSAIKSFSMTNMQLEAELDAIEDEYEVDLGRSSSTDNLGNEYDYDYQFPSALRKEAEYMAVHYKIFYCLEKSIRQLIVDIFEEEGEVDWWNKLVPDEVKKNVESGKQRELDAAMTPRSTDNIDYTTFGELSKIVESNWQTFDGIIFRNNKAFKSVMTKLNALRNPIAHFSPLAEDEVLRLKLTLRDWFRIME